MFLDRDATLEKACELIAEAGRADARLIVFPEAFIPAYPDWVWAIPAGEEGMLSELYAELVANSVAIPSASTERLCRAAQRARINVVMGLSERNMPLARYALYAWGVQIYVAATWDRGEPWLSTLRHIAKEGRVYVIGCGMALRTADLPDRFAFKQRFYGQAGEWINVGDSAIVNPSGEIIAGPLREREDILYAEVDPAQMCGPKWMLDVASHYARPDVFQLTVDQAPRQMIEAPRTENGVPSGSCVMRDRLQR